MIPVMLEIHGNILLDVTKQLQLKFNPLFEKPRRPKSIFTDLICDFWRQVLLLTVSELKSNFPLLEASSTVTCTILQTTTTKKQVSLQAQLYNKNIKLTIDKQEKYRT